jgi:carbon monoxide dehydrogenase subunit G
VTRFEATNRSEADVPAPREKIWEVVTSPDLLAKLTPVIDRITADGDVWRWQLGTISALGASVTPSFTEHMHFDDGHRLSYEHRPEDDRRERAGANGTYVLSDLDDGGTHLAVDLTLHVDLPLPGLSRRAVEGVMRATMARAGQRFAENLYAHLGLPGSPRPRSARS